jgi:hypothetical protein
MNLLALTSRDLTQGDLDAYLLALADPETRQAATAALSSLQVLCHRLVPTDLVRMAALTPDGLKTLHDLAKSAAGICAAVTAQRKPTHALVSADAAERFALDPAAIQRLGEATAAAQAHAGQAADAMKETAAFRKTMVEAGLSGEEVDRLVARRVAGDQPGAQAHLSAAAAAKDVVDQLTNFLADPLRRRDVLDPEVLDRLIGFQAASSEWAADADSRIRASNMLSMQGKRISSLTSPV